VLHSPTRLFCCQHPLLPEPPHRTAPHQPTMIRYQDDQFLLQASSIQATFSDGTTLSLTNITTRLNTPLGDEWIFASTEEDNDDDNDDDDSRVVRLILNTPTQDWRRRNQTYAWKVDSAWMSDALFTWTHWNVERFVDSQVQVPNSQSIFTTERLEFHFRPIGGGAAVNNYHDPVIITDSKVVLQNVQMGAYLERGKKTEIYKPCPGSCSVVDGQVVVGGAILVETYTSKYEWWELAPICSAAGVICMLLAWWWWCRRRRQELYERIVPEGDLSFTVEDSYESTSTTTTTATTTCKS
jgi:hypothetical protein